MTKDVIMYLMVVATMLVVSFTADAATRTASLVSDNGKQTIVCESIGNWGRTPKR